MTDSFHWGGQVFITTEFSDYREEKNSGWGGVVKEDGCQLQRKK